MKVCIVGASGKLGKYMVQHALHRGYEVVGVCRERSVSKLDEFKDRITIVPGATNDRQVIKRAVNVCDGVLTVLVPWGVHQHSIGTAQAVLDYARPGARLVFSCGWHITRDGKDVYCRHVIHHDLDWNPSSIEQRTGRVDRLGCKAENRHPILIYLPYLAGTADERQYRVMTDRESWFRIVMGQEEVARIIPDEEEITVQPPRAFQEDLVFKLENGYASGRRACAVAVQPLYRSQGGTACRPPPQRVARIARRRSQGPRCHLQEVSAQAGRALGHIPI
jgi:hypothetical protein